MRTFSRRCFLRLADEGLRRTRRQQLLVVMVALLTHLCTAQKSYADSGNNRPVYRSPMDVAFSPDGSLLAVADYTWGGVVVIDPQKYSIKHEVPLTGNPSHVIWDGADRILVSEGSTGTIAEVDAKTGSLVRRLNAVRRGAGLARTSDGKVLLVCDRGLHQVAFLELETGKVTRRVDVVREPGFIALTQDDRYAVVGNKLPRSEDARLPEHGAEVSVIEVSTGAVRNVRLPGGSSIVRQIAISADNRWAYVIHQAGRANTMVTQLDRGWVMTNCTSIIDIAAASLYTTFLFDKDGEGAANPWGVAVSPDGSKLWATLAGVSQLAVVELESLHELLANDENTRTTLHRDLQAMNSQGLMTRRTVSDVEGTRGIAINQDGSMLAVAAYFEGKVLLVDVATEQTKAISLTNQPPEDPIRKGERLFNSGKNCYQQWLSCATCHEGGRMDGLNWDLLNDGQGNPKNTRSHVLSAVTPPTNATGCRESALVSARAGYSNIEFQPASEKDVVEPTYAYIQSIVPEPSPYLGPDNQLTSDGRAGEKLFNSSETGCSKCHTPPHFTNLQRYDVGTRLQAPLGPDNGSWDDGGYDVPTLVELWRTGPYLHLGIAPTVKDVVTTYNQKDQHGKTSHLSEQQIEQLVLYLLQIGPTQADEISPVDAGTEPQEPEPVETSTVTTTERGSGCICQLSATSRGPMRACAESVGVIGVSLLMFLRRRRRQCLRFTS